MKEELFARATLQNKFYKIITNKRTHRQITRLKSLGLLFRLKMMAIENVFLFLSTECNNLNDYNCRIAESMLLAALSIRIRTSLLPSNAAKQLVLLGLLFSCET